MVIKELRLFNFLVFPGEQVLEFPTAAKTNLTIILAPNNTGKTNIIRALKFLFYGHMPDCDASTGHRLINDKVKANSGIGSAVEAWVEIALEQGEEELRIRRSFKTHKQAATQWLPGEMNLYRVFRDSKRPTTLNPDDDAVLQRKLETLVPPDLFDAFYFKGEPLDGKLLGGVRSIRKSLSSFLHQDAWEEAESAAAEVRTQFAKELQKFASKHKEYSDLLGKEETFSEYLGKKQQELTAKKKALDQAVQDFDLVNRRLAELGDASEGKKIAALLNEKNNAFHRAKNEFHQTDSQIKRLLGDSRGIPWLIDGIPAVQKILNDLHNDNILPAEVTEGFVSRVLKSESCVCGREHTDSTRNAWMRYKEKALEADMTQGLTQLLNAVDEKNPSNFIGLANETTQALKRELRAREKSRKEMRELTQEIGRLQEKLQHSNLDSIQEIGKRLRTLATQRQSLQDEVSQLDPTIKQIQNNLKNLRENIRKVQPAGAAQGKVNILEQARNRTERLRLLLHDARNALSAAFHSMLQQSVEEYYDDHAYDGSKAYIHQDTLLPSIKINGRVSANLGGGQSQLLALAYIVSLSRLRRALHEEMKRLGIGFGKLDDQSFFLDSPFNHVTEHYAHAIANFLKGNARQVVLLMARHQWELVKEIIEPAADRAYAFVYHTLKSKINDLNPGDFAYEVNGNTIQLLKPVGPDERSAYTTITALN